VYIVVTGQLSVHRCKRIKVVVHRVGQAAQPLTKGLHNGGVRCPHKVQVSLFTFVTGDRAQLVGLNISLRSIVKASYARHCANPNVASHRVGTNRFSNKTADNLLTKIFHADK